MDKIKALQQAFKAYEEGYWQISVIHNPGLINAQNPQDFLKFVEQLAPRVDEYLKQLEKLKEALVDSELVDQNTVPSLQNVQNVTFSSFLKKMGQAVLDAQKDLDEQSKGYLLQNKNASHVVPTVFRIPKVSASIKFGMKEVSESGFNIFLAKESNKEESSLDQSLNFDIQAVPPPPNIYELLSQQAPVMTMVLDAITREEIQRGLEFYEPRPEQKELAVETLLSHWDEVVITRSELEGRAVFLLFFAEKAQKNLTGIWYYEPVSPEGSKRLESILAYNSPTRKEERPDLLHDLILDFSQKQQNFF